MKVIAATSTRPPKGTADSPSRYCYSHPENAYPLLELAQLARIQLHMDDALPNATRAVQIRMDTLGAAHPETAFAKTIHAWILVGRGEPGPALSELEAAAPALQAVERTLAELGPPAESLAAELVQWRTRGSEPLRARGSALTEC